MRDLRFLWRGLTSLGLGLGLLLNAALADQQPPKNNLVYEVFVRSFFRGDGADAKGDGNLKGVVQKLDAYLNDGNPETDGDLEVGVLWLMPTFPTASYHGYDVTDYRGVNGDYGTLDDMKLLLAEAHKRGLRVILDIPLNHTSDRHPWFLQAAQDPLSEYRGYYHFAVDEGSRPGGWHAVPNPNAKLRYFGLFSSKMPDLNLENRKVREELKAIAKFWLDLGVDGFRLDAAKHIYGDRFDALREPEILRNNDWWLEFSEFVQREKKGAILVGEVLGDPELLRRHAWGLEGLIDEPFMNEARVQVSWPGDGFLARRKAFIDRARELHRSAFSPDKMFAYQPFQSFGYVASHDRNPRLASDLEEMKRNGMMAEVDPAYRLAMYVLLTVSSRPILYNGDELMQRGWKWNGNPPNAAQEPGDGSGIYDETLREPFPWYRTKQGPGQTTWMQPRYQKADDGISREEQERPDSMLALVRALCHLRARHPALADGDFGSLLNDTKEWLVFEKGAGNERYVVLINQLGHGNNYDFHEQWYPAYIGAQLIFWSDGQQKQWRDTTKENKRIANSVYVPPYGLVVIRQAR